MRYRGVHTHRPMISERWSIYYRLLLAAGLSLFLLCWLACSIATNVPYASHRSQTATVRMTPTSLSTLQNLYNETVVRYFELVVQQKYQEAYRVLSSATRSHEPYANFVVNQSYTLSRECWTIMRIVFSQQEKDGETWHVGVELASTTSCNKGCVIWYDWNTHMQMQNGLPVIVRIGLYPTGTKC